MRQSARRLIQGLLDPLVTDDIDCEISAHFKKSLYATAASALANECSNSFASDAGLG